MEPVYAPIVGSAHILLAAMGWQLRVAGLEHLPCEGPAVVAANHISYLDPLPLLWSADRRGRYLRFMGKRSLFQMPIAGPLLRQMQHVPVDRGADRGRALDAAADLLRRGEVVALFPESTISVSFVPMSLKPGAARLALDTGAALLPFAAFGLQRIATKGRPRRMRLGIAIAGAFGAPLSVLPDDDVTSITERLGVRLRAMVDALAVAYPQLPRTGPDVWWMPVHLGGLARRSRTPMRCVSASVRSVVRTVGEAAAVAARGSTVRVMHDTWPHDGLRCPVRCSASAGHACCSALRRRPRSALRCGRVTRRMHDTWPLRPGTTPERSRPVASGHDSAPAEAGARS